MQAQRVFLALIVVLACLSLAADKPPAQPDFFRLEWDKATNPYKLPDWFEGNRVQGHTRLALNWQKTPEFANAAEGFKAMGAHVFTRHTKTGSEDPWWPKVNVKAFVDDAHSKGLHIIAYNWMMTDLTMETLHPDWVCKSPTGKIIAHRTRGDQLDVTGPYREVILQRLMDLADMGFDGFYFDEAHLPVGGCWGTALASDFKKATGLDAPKAIDENDPVYREFIAFRSYRLAETFKYWRDAVKSKYPNVVFIVAAENVPGLTEPRGDTNLVRLVDSPKSEWTQGLWTLRGKNLLDGVTIAKPDDDIRMALGWTVLRDSGDGRPPHIWAAGFPTVPQVMAFTSALVTYGCIANVNVQEESILTPTDVKMRNPGASYKAAFDLGNKVSPYLAGTKPLRWAAIHFSELSRNRREGDHARAWREVLWPVTGAFGVLTREHLPVGVVNDYQLEKGQLDGYKLLFLPTPSELTPAQRKVVDKFKANGGVVISNDPSWRWDDPKKSREAAESFARAAAKYTAPVQVTGGPKKMHSVAYRAKGRLVVALTNDFTWIQQYLPKQTDDFPSYNPPPAPINGVEIIVRGKLPSRVIEAVSGRALTAEPVEGGYKVKVPGFAQMALVMAEDGQ